MVSEFCQGDHLSAIIEKNKQKSCHQELTEKSGLPVLAVVGNPNVGKSVLFNRLTGMYATVSNYPGTTVEVTRGQMHLGDNEVEVVDTPGMYSLLPISEEEAVARRLLLEEKPRQVLHVVDAKNLPRMLPLTLQLLEAGLPVTLALNMMDESADLGFSFDIELLSQLLGIPVTGTIGATNKGVSELREILEERMAMEPVADCAPLLCTGNCSHACSMAMPMCHTGTAAFKYHPIIEQAITDISKVIGANTELSARAIAVLLLFEDEEIFSLLHDSAAVAQIRQIVAATKAKFDQPLSVVITIDRQNTVNQLVEQVMQTPAKQGKARLEWLSRLLLNPWSGLPILALVLYFAIYKFVGVFGAGFLVDLLQNKLFGELINPFATKVIEQIMPPLWSNLFVGDYGVITLGITYAFAIILPIVTLFFFAFAILEDSGYLPRLAMLIDRLCKTIGLNGRAIIPLILGFGCSTMATMVTRVLETKRERVIATLLLALAIPCAAQSGVFLSMVSAIGLPGLAIYISILLLIFLVVGLLATQVIPGKPAHFYMEIPPLRLPRLANVLAKTYSRLEWYFKEVLPMFILASVLLWVGSLAWTGNAVVFSPHHGLFGMLERMLDPLGAVIGLPTSADVAANPALRFTGGTILLAGFFRRDFGAAGLWYLFQAGLLTPTQVLVSAVTFTLFLPCIAQFMMMKRERGLWMTLSMTLFVMTVAFGVGFLLRMGLLHFGGNIQFLPR